jgi:hypothetical protein
VHAGAGGFDASLSCGFGFLAHRASGGNDDGQSQTEEGGPTRSDFRREGLMDRTRSGDFKRRFFCRCPAACGEFQRKAGGKQGPCAGSFLQTAGNVRNLAGIPSKARKVGIL